MKLADTQKIVVESRLKSGYEILGMSSSVNNDKCIVVMRKGKHTIAINSLGYDEHTPGRTYHMKNPIKKKASTAQLRARKLFAQRAKAGTLKKNPARKTATKKNPARKVAVKKAVVRKNPAKKRVTVIKTSGSKRGAYGWIVRDETKGTDITTFEPTSVGKSLAKEYGQAYADKYNHSVSIRKP